jgi:hypothetical protein
MIAKPKTNLLPHEVFKKVALAKTPAARVKLLQENESFSLKTILQGNFDSRIKMDLPEGAPPYNKDKAPAGLQMARIDGAIKMLGNLIVGNSLSKIRKEMLFVQLLESIHAEDAEIVIAMKDKTLSDLFPCLTAKLVRQAFPTLLPE